MKLSKTIDQTCICKKSVVSLFNDTPLGGKSKDGFARYQDNVSKWSDMFIAGLDNNVCPGQVETSVGQVKAPEVRTLTITPPIWFK
jgi:hypothetical protein